MSRNTLRSMVHIRARLSVHLKEVVCPGKLSEGSSEGLVNENAGCRRARRLLESRCSKYWTFLTTCMWHNEHSWSIWGKSLSLEEAGLRPEAGGGCDIVFRGTIESSHFWGLLFFAIFEVPPTYLLQEGMTGLKTVTKSLPQPRVFHFEHE